MTRQLTDPSHREDGGFPQPWTAASANDLGVRPGESNPGQMLAGVLMLVVSTVIMILALAWWLT